MIPQEFARAAQALAAGATRATVPGLPGVLEPGMRPLLALAGLCDQVFLARPPQAPGAVVCGATHTPDRGPPIHAAGLGATPVAAFVRAMGEIAEGRALQRMPQDPRLDRDNTLPRLDHLLRPDGRIGAAALLRDSPGPHAPPRGLAAGPTLADAARAAWHEAVERHAITVWASGAAPARPLTPPAAVLTLQAALRQGQPGPAVWFLALPAAVPGLHAVAALSRQPEGPVPGYGCATDPVTAMCKAMTEVVLAEFALHLEARALTEEGRPLPANGFTARAAWLATRPDLTDPAAGSVADGPSCRPGFAVLTRPDDGVPVALALTPDLHNPAELATAHGPGPI